MTTTDSEAVDQPRAASTAPPDHAAGSPPSAHAVAVEIDSLDIGSGLRRRPLMYIFAGALTAIFAGLWGHPSMLWVGAGLVVAALLSVLRPEKDETFLSYSGDLVIVVVLIAVLGMHPAAGTAIWAGTIVSGYFSLDQGSGHRLVLVAAGSFAGLALLGDRLAIVELTDGQRLAADAGAICFGFLYLVLVLPYISAEMRAAIRASSELAELRRQEAEFRASLASTVAHELRTPIAGIQGFVEVLAASDGTLSDEERREFLDIVVSQASSLGAIVEDLLVAFQHERGELSVDRTAFDISATVDRIIREMNPTLDRHIGFQAPPGLRAMGDPRRVGQIVRNLVTNADKYGGERVAVAIERRGDAVRLVVADDGDGIAPEDVERVFEPFERSSEGSGGYGLGLPISRRLARAMGGDLVYEDSRHPLFVLTLPVPD